jgi:SAM-dependent methyltransferase
MTSSPRPVLDPAEITEPFTDLLGDEDPTGRLPGQRLMASRALPLIYERLWRPLGGRLLDVACGSGGFTRIFARHAAVAIGVDASRTMLAEAVREGGGARYVRASASALPFRDASFDAVCCFAALYLIEEPYEAIAEIARVLAPGGRVALLSSVARGPVPAAVTDALVRPLTGVRIFGRDDLTRALVAEGLVDVRRRMSGLAQFVSARRP